MRSMVVIENAVIDAMRANPEISREFASCLAPLSAPAQPGVSCKKCGNKNLTAYAEVKSCFVHMADSRRNELKRLLDTQQIRITIKLGGQLQTFQF